METPQQFLILLVDDEPLIRMVTTGALEDDGYRVIEAESAEGALAVMRSRSDVGVLFTDVNMPGRCDGIELARLVHESWPKVHIVITSGRSDMTALVGAGERFLLKPYRV